MGARDTGSRLPRNAQPHPQDEELALLAAQLRQQGASIAHIQTTLDVSRRRARQLVAEGVEAVRQRASRRRHEFNNAAHVARAALRELRTRIATPDDRGLLEEVDRSVATMTKLFKALATPDEAIGET